MLNEILETAKKHKPMFTTYDELLAWREKEAVKDSIRINNENKLNRLKKIQDGAGVPLAHALCGFDNYKITEIEQGKQQTHALNVSKFYADSFRTQLSECRCMILRGTTGTGKNHLASAIVTSVLEQGYSALIIKMSDLMSKFRESYHPKSNIRESQVMRTITQVDLLVLDEIDVTHDSVDEFVLLNRIIDKRLLNFKPLIIISNLTIDVLRERLRARVFDRLLSNDGVVVNFDWSTYRRKKKA